MFGQFPPSFIRLPVLNENLHKPPDGVCLHDVDSSPGQVSGHQIPIGFFPFIFDGDHKALFVMSADIESSRPHDGGDLLSSSDCDLLRRAWITGEVFLNGEFSVSKVDVLITPDLADRLRLVKGL